MPFLFALISINVLSVSLILVLCGKKENESNGNQPTKPAASGSSKIENKTVQIAFTATETTPSNYKRPDIYHKAAENLAFPASARCKNHDDAWRVLALYLDYIRAVNPVEFEQHKLLDSALAVLHDFSYTSPDCSQIPNETLALGVVYFLVDFNNIKVNLGTPSQPWYTILCRNAKFEEMERMRIQIEHYLVGLKSDGSSSELKASIIETICAQ